MKKDKWSELAAMFNWLADIFYKMPTQDRLIMVKDNIDGWPLTSKSADKLISRIKESVESDLLNDINRDFHRLFIGPGKKAVYPWGSIYTDKEGLLFGPSTIVWENFCIQYKVDIKTQSYEPTDHFALIFSALGAIIMSDYDEKSKKLICHEVLATHFGSWGDKVLSMIEVESSTNYYRSFATLAKLLIEDCLKEVAN